MREKVKLILGVLIIAVLLVLIGWIVYNGVSYATDNVEHPVVSFEVKDKGTVSVELYPEYAPNTVANFIALANSGYYNDKLVYGKDNVCLYVGRSDDEQETEETTTESEDEENDEEDKKTVPMVSYIDDSIETGSDEDYQYEIDGEFIANGFEQNTLKHEKGVLSLNRYDYSYYGLTEESYNSGSAQFSVMMSDESNLNGVYCAFGKVIEGLDILEEIYNNAEVVVEESTEQEENAEINTETDTEETEEQDEEEDNSIKKFVSMPVISNVNVDTIIAF